MYQNSKFFIKNYNRSYLNNIYRALFNYNRDLFTITMYTITYKI